MTELKAAVQPVGLIGVGLLGSALAKRLISAGFPVWGYDNDPHQLQLLAALGGRPVDSASSVVQQCERVLLSLPDSHVVNSVVDSVVEYLSAGKVVIDTTTGDPQATEDLARRLAALGVDYVDATVAGSSAQAEEGRVLVLAGGTLQGYQASLDIFDSFAEQRFHVGTHGKGAQMKLVVNLALGLHRAVLAEALALGESFGFAAREILDVLVASPAYSRVMETKGSKMVERDFRPQARLRQHLKDVRLILHSGERNKTPLPLSNVHVDLLETVASQGFGDEDNSAILRAYIPRDATQRE